MNVKLRIDEQGTDVDLEVLDVTDNDKKYL